MKHYCTNCGRVAELPAPPAKCGCGGKIAEIEDIAGTLVAPVAPVATEESKQKV